MQLACSLSSRTLAAYASFLACPGLPPGAQSKSLPQDQSRGERLMKRYKSWTLTDTQHDIWLDSFATGRGHVALPVNEPWSIRKRTLKGGLRDGIDLIEVCNGSLSYSILPTRGM